MSEAYLVTGGRPRIGRYGGALADPPVSAPGLTLNRLCGSGLNAVATAAPRSGPATRT
jgi:acetyl-CoA acetyltransferase